MNMSEDNETPIELDIAETGPQVEGGLFSDTAAEYEAQMAEQAFATEQIDGEFFTDTSAGKADVRLPTEFDTFFQQAQEVSHREDMIKEELDEKGTSVEEQIRVGKKTMADHDKSFSEARNAEEILGQLRNSNELLVAERYNISNNPDLPQDGLHFIVKPEAVTRIEESFKKLGYSVKKIPGKGIIVQGDFTTYTFLTGKNLKEQKMTGEKEYVEDDDYDEYDESERLDGKKIRKQGKSDRLSKKKKGEKMTAQTAAKRPPISPGAKAATRIKPEEGIFDSEIIIPATPGPAPLSTPDSGSRINAPMEKPEALSTPNQSTPLTGGAGLPGGGAGGVGGIAPGAG